MSGRRYTKAFVEHLKGDSQLLVFTGRVPGLAADAPARYVLVFPQTPDHSVSSLAGPATDESATFTVHSVAESPEGAQWIADRVIDRVLGPQRMGVRLTLPGRASEKLKHTGSFPINVDRQAPPEAWFLADDFRWDSSPS